MLKETNFRPKLIWIFTESAYEDQILAIEEGFRIISMRFDFKPKISYKIISEGDIVEAGLEIGGLITSLKEGHEVALDITSARKALVVGAMLSTSNNQPDYVYYLLIDSLQDASKPYPMIHKQHHELIDFRDQVRRIRR